MWADARARVRVRATVGAWIRTCVRACGHAFQSAKVRGYVFACVRASVHACCVRNMGRQTNTKTLNLSGHFLSLALPLTCLSLLLSPPIALSLPTLPSLSTFSRSIPPSLSPLPQPLSPSPLALSTSFSISPSLSLLLLLIYFSMFLSLL